MRKNTIDIPQEEMDRFHKAMDAERTEQDARLEKLIESEKANIPSNEEIIKLIPSKAVREYLQKIGHQFSERNRYLLWLYLDPKKEDESEDTLSNEDVLSTENQIIDKHIEAFKNLADGEK